MFLFIAFSFLMPIGPFVINLFCRFNNLIFCVCKKINHVCNNLRKHFSKESAFSTENLNNNHYKNKIMFHSLRFQ